MEQISDFIRIYFPEKRDYDPSFPSDQFHASCVITSNQPNGIVCYGTGDLAYIPPRSVHDPLPSVPREIPGSYKGNINQFFSNRTDGSRTHPQKFLISSFDVVELKLEASVARSTISGTFKFITPAGSPRSIHITGTDAGVIYGTSYFVGGPSSSTALWTFSFGPITRIG